MSFVVKPKLLTWQLVCIFVLLTSCNQKRIETKPSQDSLRSHSIVSQKEKNGKESTTTKSLKKTTMGSDEPSKRNREVKETQVGFVYEEYVKLFDDFSYEERQDWYAIHKPWLRKGFLSCVKSSGFKLDCRKGCSNLYILSEIDVDVDGKIVRWFEKDADIDCPQKTGEEINEIKQCIEKSFKQKILPTSLRKRRNVIRVGFVSRC